MKRILTSAAVIAMIASAAMAGGPVIEGEEPPMVADSRDEKRPNILPILVGLGIIAIIASSGGGGGSTEPTCYGDVGPTDPGC